MKVTALSVFVVAGLLSSGVGAQQKHRGSAEDQAACTPDVYRLCASEIPDEDDIVACLIRKKDQLSAACHEVFSRPDSPKAPPPKPDNGDGTTP